MLIIPSSVLYVFIISLPNIHLFTNKGEHTFISHSDFTDDLDRIGRHKMTAWIPGNLLNNSTYIIEVVLSTMIPLQIHVDIRDAIIFQVLEDIESSKKNDFNQRIPGIIRPRLEWTVE